MARSLIILFMALMTASPAAAAASPLAVGRHTFAVGHVKLWYRVAGPHSGSPVVFLHGGPAEGSQGFAHTVGPLLERRLQMVYLDQRGAGHSDRPADAAAYSMAILVEDLERLRRHLRVRKLALLGHSYGAALALEYAAHYPTRVSRIILVSAVPDAVSALNAQCDRLRRDDPAAYATAKAAADQPGDPDCIPMEGFRGPAKRAYFERTAGDKPGTLAQLEQADTIEGITIGGPAHAALAEPSLHYRFAHRAALTMPVLAIAGERDGIADPAPVASLIAGLGRGRLLRYPDAGHFLFVDAPHRFARDVAVFMGTPSEVPAGLRR